MQTIEEQVKVILSGGAEVTPKDGLAAKLKTAAEEKRPLRIKLGVDPTAPDLHIGHAVPLRKLRQFQDLGQQVVLIIGGGTAQIGDPSGRDKTRPVLSRAQIDENAETYLNQAFKILDRDKTEVCNNADWLEPLDMKDLLQLMAKFTVAQILDRNDFQTRYQNKQSIGMHEFLYPIMQAYDSVMVRADVEMGGTDQLFNLLAGRELMVKSGMEPQICLTLPLLEGTDGVKKMSKSYGNYIAINDAPAEMFGKVMSIPDEIMPRYLYLASSYPFEESERLIAGVADGSLHPNQVKRDLAKNIIAIYYDEAVAAAAEAQFDKVFKQDALPEDIPEFAGLLVENDKGLVYLPGLLASSALHFTNSNGDARKLIDGGGVKVGGEVVSDYELDPAALKGQVIQVGKRKFAKLM